MQQIEKKQVYFLRTQGQNKNQNSHHCYSRSFSKLNVYYENFVFQSLVTGPFKVKVMCVSRLTDLNPFILRINLCLCQYFTVVFAPVFFAISPSIYLAVVCHHFVSLAVFNAMFFVGIYPKRVTVQRRSFRIVIDTSRPVLFYAYQQRTR